MITHIETLPFEEMYLVPIGDVHLGDKAFTKESRMKLRETIDFVAEHENARVVLMGDILNTATRGSKTSPFEQNMDLKEQIETSRSLFQPIAGKIIGAVTGNHEGRIEDFAGYDPTIALCHLLGIKHFKYTGVVTFRLGERMDRGKVKNMVSYTAVFQHSVGGGKKIGSKLNRAEEMRNCTISNADIYCLTPETMITCYDGVYPIKDIRVGDLVLTKEGGFKNVTKLFERKADTIFIETRGGFQNLNITTNHPVLTRKIEKKRKSLGTVFVPVGEEEWKEAGNIKPGDFIAIQNEDYSTIDTPKIFGQYLDSELARFVGLYIAEGNTNRNGIDISLNDDEEEYKELCKSVCARFGLNYTESLAPGTKSYQIHIHSKRLMTYFLEFGKSAHSKRIPKNYYYMRRDLTEEMIGGIYDGDGCVGKTREIKELGTASKELAYQVAFLLNRLGYNPCVTKPKSSCYKISYSINKKLERRYFDGERKWVEVTKVGKYKSDVTVHNFEVEDSHTYIANGIVVHNCAGHNHALTTGWLTNHELDHRNGVITPRNQVVVTTGSYLDWNNSYAEKSQLAPMKLGSPIIKLDGKKKNISVSL